jgi:hypothetical protein
VDNRARRRWRRENSDEIERAIAWINGPDVYTPFKNYIDAEGDVILMEIERISWFGLPAQSKKTWKTFLQKKGISADMFN